MPSHYLLYSNTAYFGIDLFDIALLVQKFKTIQQMQMINAKIAIPEKGGSTVYKAVKNATTIAPKPILVSQ